MLLISYIIQKQLHNTGTDTAPFVAESYNSLGRERETQSMSERKITSRGWIVDDNYLLQG